MEAHVGRPPAHNTVISITRSKTFGLSKSFCQEFGTEQWLRAILYFDAYRKRIAFRFTNDRTHPGSFALNQATTGALSIRADGFFGKYDITVQRHAGKYRVQRHTSRTLGIDADDDSFVIQLRGRRRSSAHDG